MTDKFNDIPEHVAQLESAAAAARASGDELAADGFFREALDLALRTASVNGAAESALDGLEMFRTAARLALHCGEAELARQLVDEAIKTDHTISNSDRWAELRDMSEWPDAWLIAAARRDPPDMAALDMLVNRSWKSLFGRCQLLTVDHDKARDLAQQAWCRVLRARHELKPGGKFLAYIATVATNLWLDTHRSARRAGPLADRRLVSLDAPHSTDRDNTITLANIIPDARSSQTQTNMLLRLDLDRALEQLPPHLREVLVARFVADESCASIASRHDRTEQTVSGWVREAIRELKRLLEEPARGVDEAKRS